MNHAKDEPENIEENNNDNNGSKLISDNYQNKTNILTRIKKHNLNNPPPSYPSKEKDNSKQRKTDLGDFVSKKVKIEEKKQEKNEQKAQAEKQVEEQNQDNDAYLFLVKNPLKSN